MTRALFGGSFDPFHNGHLALVRHLLDGGWADRVIVVPTAHSPHKGEPIAPGPDRIRLARLALQDIARAEVDGREVERGGISYTVDTLAELKTASPDDRWRLVIGADNAAAFTTWRDWRRLLEMAELLVVPRGGADLTLPDQLRDNAVIVRDFAHPATATAVRSALAKQELSRADLPPAIADVIATERLYGWAPDRDDAVALIIIDGSALIYRSHYAFASRPLTAPSGEVTSVVFGFFNSVLRLIDAYQPEYLVIAFDLPVPTFRHEMYPKYKANRKPMPEELAGQLPRLRELLEAWDIAVLELAGYEADDVMATLAKHSAGVCSKAWFYTGDKDFLQLLDSRTGMLKPGRRGDEITTVTDDAVRREYDLEPAALIDVFALAGDSSDNIPGAPGIGMKTALKLIQQFGDLDGLYARLAASQLTPRIKRILTENREQVLLSRRLFVIDSDVPLELDFERFTTRLPTGAQVAALLQQLGLRRIQNLIGKLALAHADGAGTDSGLATERPPDTASPGAAAAATDTTNLVGAVDAAGTGDNADAAETAETAESGDSADAADAVAASDPLDERGYRLLADAAALKEWLADLPTGAALAVDTETDGLRVDTARLVGVSLAAPGLPPAYVPVLERREGGEVQTQGAELFATGEEINHLGWVSELLGPLLADAGRKKIGQNLKFDTWILTRHGMPLAGPRFDTMIASYVLDPGRRSHGLDELSLELLGHRAIGYGELFGAGDRRRDILSVPLPKLALYAAEDADLTLRLYDVLTQRLADGDLERLFSEVEMPVSEVLFTMERHGIKLDTAFLDELRNRFAAELDRLEQQIFAEAGQRFNVQSPKQLSEILFTKLRLKPLKKTATGWSTDASVLSRLTDKHPLPQLVLEYREVAKLQNTYVETLPSLANPRTGLIHTSYNQAVAATGRLSSSDPNLQNIPVRTELGRQIRRAFVPRRPDNLFLSADYSQVELRLMAHLSGDAALASAFADGVDVHRRTAALIAGIAETDVTIEMRSRAKAINFGVIYGMGARALARQISVPVKQAQEFITTYFETYPGVRAYIDETKERARRDGYVATMLGRRRYLPDILSSNNQVRSFQERIAVNTPIQGTAADLIKLAMIRIAADLRRSDSSAMLLLQVHDELVFELHRDETGAISDLVRSGMEGALALSVPLVVDLHTGTNWAEAHG